MKISYGEPQPQEEGMDIMSILKNGPPKEVPGDVPEEAPAPQLVIGAFGPIISHTIENGQMMPMMHPELGQHVQLLQTLHKGESGFFSLDSTNSMVLYKDGTRVEVVNNIVAIPEGSRITDLSKEQGNAAGKA